MSTTPNPDLTHYLELGFGLVHIQTGSKAPKGNGWQENPITSLEEAAKAWRHGGNVGMVHAHSGTLALDVDDYEGTQAALDRVGIDLDELLAAPGPKIVGKRGAKPLYRLPEGLTLKRVALTWATAETCHLPKREHKLETIFELRAGATQDVLPGSIHPDGIAYRWDGEPKNRDDIPLIPGGLLALAQNWTELKPLMLEAAPGYAPPKPKARKAATSGSGIIEMFNRDYNVRTVLQDHGYTLKGVDRYLSPHSSSGLAGGVVLKGDDGLERVYSHHGSDPLSTGHAEDAFGAWCLLEHGGDMTAAVREAARALGIDGEGRKVQATAPPDDEPEAPWKDLQPLPGLYPPVPELPAELIPEPLRPWLSDIAERASLPLEFVTCPALVALGATIGRGVGIYPKRRDDWLVVPNIWGGIVGKPGVMKSAAISEPTKPLKALANKAREAFQEAQRDAEAETARLELEVSALKEQAKKDAKKGGIGEDFAETLRALMGQLADATVTERRYYTQDPTVEKLGELLRENPRGMLVLRDELAGWLRTLERPGREGEREFYLEAWNGNGGYTFDRIGRGTVHIDALTLTILGGIQPGKLEKYLDEAIAGGGGADGLLQRFQLVVYPGHVGEYKHVDRHPDKAAKQKATAIFETLDALDHAELGLDAQEGGIPALHFSDDAQELFDTWRTELEHRLRSDDLDHKPAYASHIAKYRSLMPSLALIFHLVGIADGTASGPVSLTAAQLAAAWCEYLEAHALKLYASEISSHVKAAQFLELKIDDGGIEDGKTSVRDLYRRGWEGLDDRDTLMSGLEVLAECNWIRLEEKVTGGRPSQVVRLHPELRGGNT